MARNLAQDVAVEADRLTGQAQRQVTLALAAVLAGLVALGAVAQFMMVESWARGLVWGYSALALVTCAGLGWRDRLYSRRLAGRLERSSLLQLLMLGQEELGAVYRYTASPWQVFLGARPATPAGWVRLLAFHLDWYLRLPAPHLRLSWPLYTLLLCLAGLTPFLYFVAVKPYHLSDNVMLYPPLVLFSLYTVLVYAERLLLRSHAAALKAYLAARIEP